MTDLMTRDLVVLDADLGGDREEVIGALARVVTDAGRATDGAALERDVLAREAKAATGMKGGIAIPHCRSAAVTEPTLAFARVSPSVDFGAKDGPAELVFLIAAPEGGGNTHMQILTKLARALVKPEFTDALRAAGTPEEVVAIVGEQVAAPAGAAAQPSSTGAEPTPPDAAGSSVRRLVAVTSCPTGIAHTYMAAEALENAARRAGVEITVETQGSAGGSTVAQADIDAADAVIFAADVGVRDRGRFAGKPVVTTGVKGPIDDGDAIIAEALAHAASPNPPRVAAGGGDGGSQTQAGGQESWGGRVRRVLMTGVSYMIPFVAAGGLLIALGFLLGGYEITGPADDIVANNTLFNLPDLQESGLEHALLDSALLAYLGALLFKLGALAFGFLVPALAGYIAYAIADRPGIAPGFVMGAVAGAINTGFLGGIVGGVLAGLVAHWIAGWQVPAALRGLMPVLVIPLGATLVSGLLMLLVLAEPLGSLMTALNNGLDSMSGGSAVVLGAVLGLMMAFDMGGPLNKVAYGFATAGLSAAGAASDAPQLTIMAAVMLAGMVPPIALALATVVRPRLFDSAERENGKAAWLMGASFITEGAIPFAAADPVRVIPSIMLGSAVTGGLAQALDVSLRAPHGGVFVLFAVGNVVGFLISLAAGVLVAAAAVIALKSIGRSGSTDRADAEVPPAPVRA
ncbi:fructose-specific PTS transporter subunit EIIC [Nocardioides panacisoli]|uniref:PTS fructose transporter subunit IIABC n=1 Tax=Nocardioides panacisoli TaxID=627624 RepID=UPI001C6377C9|nr:fructose-specific PTS transporter subunit EIIC [Nocardioides panacisoli]QYJ05651.1 fructose-specific PTS transporter subunit EIIC [Nocardioides panacisoli]